MKLAISIVVLVIAPTILADRASAQYHWKRATPGAFQGLAFNPLSNGETIYAASYDSMGIYRSDDHGLTWARYYDGLEPFATSDIRQFLCVPTDTNVVLAVSPRKVYRSTNGGRSWSEIANLGGIEGEDIDYQAATDALYYGQNFKGPTWKSIDHGATWSVTGEASDMVGLCTIAVSPDLPPVLLAGSEGGEIARSTEEGASWTIQLHTDTGTALEAEVPKIVYSKHAISTSGIRGVVFSTRWPSNGGALVKSVDNGLTWSSLHHPSKNPWALDIDQRAEMIAKPSDPAFPGPLRFWTGLFHDRSDTVTNGLIQETTDGGLSWHSTGFPLGVEGDPNNPMTRDVWVMKYDTTSGRLIASTSTGVWVAETKAGVNDLGQPPTKITVVSTSEGIVISGLERAQVSVYDLLGRRLRSAASTRVRLTDLPHGAYVVRIESSRDAATRVIER